MPYQVKFYDQVGREVADLPQGKERMPLLNFYRWAMERAMNEEKDLNRAASFASDLRKHEDIPEIQRELGAVMFMMRGKELVEFIRGFTVPGVHRVEFVEVK